MEFKGTCKPQKFRCILALFSVQAIRMFHQCQELNEVKNSVEGFGYRHTTGPHLSEGRLSSVGVIQKWSRCSTSKRWLSSCRSHKLSAPFAPAERTECCLAWWERLCWAGGDEGSWTQHPGSGLLVPCACWPSVSSSAKWGY